MSGYTMSADRCRAGVAWLLALSCWLGAVYGEETDSRLHSDGKGWKLNRAKVVDPTRPRVLLIGDSILGGYLKGVAAALEGEAYVDGWMNPYHQASGNLEAMLSEVLAHGPYDLVHFNMGLHGWQPDRIPADKFVPLTQRVVDIIRRGSPRAVLIWASSTPVTVKGKPTELDPVINPTIIEHNRLAAKVMAEAGVPVADFYALLVPHLELARGDQFHWQAPAYAILAEAVVASVRKRLPAPVTKVPSAKRGTR